MADIPTDLGFPSFAAVFNGRLTVMGGTDRSGFKKVFTYCSETNRFYSDSSRSLSNQSMLTDGAKVEIFHQLKFLILTIMSMLRGAS